MDFHCLSYVIKGHPEKYRGIEFLSNGENHPLGVCTAGHEGRREDPAVGSARGCGDPAVGSAGGVRTRLWGLQEAVRTWLWGLQETVGLSPTTGAPLPSLLAHRRTGFLPSCQLGTSPTQGPPFTTNSTASRPAAGGWLPRH